MSRAFIISLALLAPLGLSGCASATLTIKVDIYDEDPRVEPPMSPAEAERMLADLQNLESAATRERALQIKLAEGSYATFAAAWGQADGDPEVTKTLKAKKLAYVNAFGTPAKEFEDALTFVRDSIEDYTAKYSEAYEVAAKKVLGRRCKDARGCPTETGEGQSRTNLANSQRKTASENRGDDEIIRKLPRSLINKENKIRRRLTEVVGAYWAQRDIQPAFFVNWLELENLLSTRYVIATSSAAGTNEAKVIEQITIRTRSQITGLQREIDRFSGTDTAAGTMVAIPGRPSDLFGSTVAIGIELESLRNDLPNNATSLTALSGLVRRSSRFLELIDRLQDPSDPVWRIISDPLNKGHWNKQFTKTYFHGEGNTGVVVVRDNPMHFRIQSGTNDPAVLIQGQLDVARTVATAALSVAGAATGMPTQPLQSGSGSPSGSSEGGAGNADAFQKRKASADEKARIRQRTLASLQRYLNGAAVSLSATEDAEAIEAQRNRLISVLKGHRTLLAPAP